MDRPLFQEICNLHIDKAVLYLDTEIARIGTSPFPSGNSTDLPNNQPDAQFSGIEQWLGNWNDFKRSTGPMGPNVDDRVLPAEDMKRIYGTFERTFKETFPKLAWCDRHEAVAKLWTMLRDVKAGILSAGRQTAEQREEFFRSLQLLRTFWKKVSNTLEALEPATA